VFAYLRKLEVQQVANWSKIEMLDHCCLHGTLHCGFASIVAFFLAKSSSI